MVVVEMVLVMLAMDGSSGGGGTVGDSSGDANDSSVSKLMIANISKGGAVVHEHMQSCDETHFAVASEVEVSDSAPSSLSPPSPASDSSAAVLAHATSNVHTEEEQIGMEFAFLYTYVQVIDTIYAYMWTATTSPIMPPSSQGAATQKKKKRTNTKTKANKNKKKKAAMQRYESAFIIDQSENGKINADVYM